MAPGLAQVRLHIWRQEDIWRHGRRQRTPNHMVWEMQISSTKKNTTMKEIVEKGTMYQEQGSSLLELVDQNACGLLNHLAEEDGARKVTKEEAESLGFHELAEWAQPGDVITVIGDAWFAAVGKEGRPW